MSNTSQTTRSLRRPQGNRLDFQSVLATQLHMLSRYAVGRATARPPDEEPVDMARLLEMVSDDPVELREVVNMYLEESEKGMGELWASVQAGDWDQTERLAHRLAGTAATCGMIAEVTPLHELEVVAKAGRWSKNQALLLDAARQHVRIAACLKGYGLGRSVAASGAWEAMS